MFPLLARIALLLFLLLLPKCIAVAIAQDWQPPIAVVEGDASRSLLNKHTTNFELDVPCQEDDESIRLAFEVSTPSDPDSPCRHPQVRVNGEHVSREWDDSGVGRASLALQGRRSANGQSQSLLLTSESSCVPSADGADIDTPFNVFVVNSTNPEQPDCSANFALNLAEILKSLPQIPVPEDSEPPDPELSHKESLEEEIKKLEDLQQELKRLQTNVRQQETLVQHIAHEDLKHGIDEFGDCKTVTCILKTAFNKAKTTFKVFFLRYKPSTYDTMASTGDKFNAAGPQSSLSSSKGIHVNSKCSCSEKDGAQHFHNSKENPLSHAHSESHPTYLTILDIVAGLICCGYLFSGVYNCCCSPRARAERAAQREERQNAREYRSLARRHAWKTWWEQTILRKNPSRGTADYEEKRSLINAQEAVLEDAMQTEIRRIRRSHGYVDEHDAAESGRASPSGLSRTETLPPYRSRTSSSGRPPSYHEYDGGVIVVNGLRSYTPTGTDVTPNDTDSLAGSSVPNLSPRHSSETLRTERSVL